MQAALISIGTSREKAEESCQRSTVETKNCDWGIIFGGELQYCGVGVGGVYHK